MSISFWSSISFRTGLYIAFFAALFSAVSSYLFFSKTYDLVLETSQKQLEQLILTVEDSASVACYLDNKELASEIVRGLEKNDIVRGVSIKSQTGMSVESGIVDEQNHYNRSIDLFSPFLKDETVGRILVSVNQALINENAEKTALFHTITLALHSLLIVMIVIVIVTIQMTSPLKKIASALSVIVPGSKDRIKPSKTHARDEVGSLVNDINHLLTSVESTLDQEKCLRLEIESLGKQFRLIFENASGGIALVDGSGKLKLHNPSFKKVIGGQWSKLLIDTDALLFQDIFEDSEGVLYALSNLASITTPIELDLKLKANYEKQSRWLHILLSSVQDESGELLAECILYDVSARTRREQQIMLEAERDPLTKLYNRRAGERRVDELLSHCDAENTQLALMLIDLDKFKPINDIHGHDAGDKVLVEVAHRLTSVLRQSDVIIRWGGDEFVVVVVQGHNGLNAELVAQNILSEFEPSIDLGDGITDSVGASVGISIYPDNAGDQESLLLCADKSMYAVKQKGRNGYAFFS